MKISTRVAGRFVLASFLAVSATAWSQQQNAAASASEQAAEPAEDAAASPPRRTITIEKREQGIVTEATVTRGNNTYHLRPNAPVGSAMPGDAQSSGNRAPQWQLFQFDLKRNSAASGASAPQPPVPASEK